MEQPFFKAQIALQLRARRKQLAMSLSATAEATGVSKAMLGQIERQESSPTIATLWKISRGLEFPFSAFFANEPQLLESENSFPEDPNMQVQTVFPFKADTGLEVFSITLLNQHEQVSSAHCQGCVEHIHVISGLLAIYFDGVWHELKAGEAVRFFADQAHSYKGVSATVTFQNIVSYVR